MGKEGDQSERREGQGRRKNKSRMNYLKQVRQGGGGRGGRGGGGRGGDYVSAYGRDGQKKRYNRQYLAPGMRGFLLTTNFRETDCVREGYNLLNEYYKPEDEVKVLAEGGEDGSGEESKSDDQSKDEVKMEESEDASSSATAAAPPDDDDDDIDKALEKEMKELKSRSFKFQSVETGAKNIVFIKTSLERPNEIAVRIFEDVFNNKETKSRNILRFVPIEGTCHIDDQSIRRVSKEVFTPYFAGGYKSFKIIVNIRYSRFSKDDAIKTLAEVVNEINPLNVVNLTDPEYTIVVEVIKSTMCLAVLKDFIKFKKYNILEIVSPTPVAVAKSKSSEDGQVEVDSKALPEGATQVDQDDPTALQDEANQVDLDDNALPEHVIPESTENMDLEAKVTLKQEKEVGSEEPNSQETTTGGEH